ncbi:hypothetical protein QTO34_018324 [Cnephaeus nilssonii]|uniref:Uncharacterized protein n=1 Tax=Cnephaeus nilssonii TaxID=3371016 RepID=A0AA40HYL4_CNENI|nr:hypothetical protein QTO34_018324 [Eptesicus nilssonii]
MVRGVDRTPQEACGVNPPLLPQMAGVASQKTRAAAGGSLPPSHSSGFVGPKPEGSGPQGESGDAGTGTEALTPHIWNRLHTATSRKSYQPGPMEPWMEPLSPFEDVTATDQETQGGQGGIPEAAWRPLTPECFFLVRVHRALKEGSPRGDERSCPGSSLARWSHWHRRRPLRPCIGPSIGTTTASCGHRSAQSLGQTTASCGHRIGPAPLAQNAASRLDRPSPWHRTTASLRPSHRPSPPGQFGTSDKDSDLRLGAKGIVTAAIPISRDWKLLLSASASTEPQHNPRTGVLGTVAQSPAPQASACTLRSCMAGPGLSALRSQGSHRLSYIPKKGGFRSGDTSAAFRSQPLISPGPGPPPPPPRPLLQG